MARDDFSEPTKRKLAQRAGGRCSFPGCDNLCWLPGTEPDQAVNVGVAAHIKAASPEGPRYDASQSPEERKSISNGIYLCEHHARLIDADPDRFPIQDIEQWKERHERQIIGEGNGSWVFPEFEMVKTSGYTVKADSPKKITGDSIGGLTEHRLVVRNATDFEYRRIGFRVQYPEFIEKEPEVTAPPGYSYTVEGENETFQINTSGSGSVTLPETQRYGSFVFEGTSLIQGQGIELLLRSTPDQLHEKDTENRIHYWICGEVAVNVGTILKTQPFSLPLIYDPDQRRVTCGFPHVSKPQEDPYVMLQRLY